MTVANQPIPLSQLGRRITGVFASNSDFQNVWVTGETSDVRISGGHCYFELIEKDPQTGRQLAKMRATIWASTYYRIAAKFLAETGERFRSDLKVMVLVSVNFHQVFGLSLNISDINGAYTLGDAMQRRNQMIARLKEEGIINNNREKLWPDVVQRIAVVSAKGAAGYGDFINQLYHNPFCLKFVTRLFPAVLQGESAPKSIIAALESIAAEDGCWDCVVIIRGGGATSDLQCFDDYDLAANIAEFPIPVIIGIGHERDVTLLDYVANMRVKTPTAAAEWLIQRGETALAKLQEIGAAMLMAVSERMSGCHRQLSYVQGLLPGAVTAALERTRSRLLKVRMALEGVPDRQIRPEMLRLDATLKAIATAVQVRISAERQKLQSYNALNDALSPNATLKRGYSITRVGKKSVCRAAQVPEGAIIETILADGTIFSAVQKTDIRES